MSLAKDILKTFEAEFKTEMALLAKRKLRQKQMECREAVAEFVEEGRKLVKDQKALLELKRQSDDDEVDINCHIMALGQRPIEE